MPQRMKIRSFTPFQIWLETQLAGGRTLTNIAQVLGVKLSQLSFMRHGFRSFPKTRLEAGMLLTGLSLEQLLVKASPSHEAGKPMEPEALPPIVGFGVTPERVRVALEYGLKFGPEREAFCASQPDGDLDKAWRDWCAARTAQPQPIGKAPPAAAPAPALYDHLRPDMSRPDFRPDPGLAASTQSASGGFTVRVGAKS